MGSLFRVSIVGAPIWLPPPAESSLTNSMMLPAPSLGTKCPLPPQGECRLFRDFTSHAAVEYSSVAGKWDFGIAARAFGLVSFFHLSPFD